MSVADKLLQVNQVKQDIKQAIENKGVPMTNVAFTEYANKIADISGGGGGHDDTLEGALNVFSLSDASTNDLKLAWEDYKRTPELKYDLNLTFELSMEGMFDVYSGDSVLTQLYNDCVNEVIQVNKLTPIDNQIFPKVALMYQGNVSSETDSPLYSWSVITSENTSDFNKYTIFLSDLTSFGMGVGISLLTIPSDLKFTNIKIFGQYENYEQGLIADLSEVTAFPAINNADFPFYIVDNVEEIGDYTFSDWTTNNHPLVIPDSVTSIGTYAFVSWIANNQPLVIGNSVTSIGDYAFQNWSSNNQQLTIPNSVTSIGKYAFQSWTANDQPLVIGNSVTSIGDYAFQNWSSNNHPLVIPNSVMSIGSDAFNFWSANDQPLVIPNSVTSINSTAFNGWTSNNQPLVIPNSVTSIGEAAFQGWTANDQPLVIPNSVTSIGGNAFRNWSSNNHPIIIPSSVISIGWYAFSGWSLVPYIEIQAITPPTLGNAYAFSGQNDAPIYVPDESVDDYKTATNWVDLADRIRAVSEKP